MVKRAAKLLPVESYGMNERCAEILQPGQIWTAAFFLVNFHADIELLGCLCSIGAELGGICG
jgi:hypothetical protein